MNNPILIDFLKEFFLRLSTKSPKFFKVIQIISLVTMLVAGLPSLIEWLGITLPPALTVLENKIVGIAATTAYIISMLTTQSKVTAITPEGTAVKQTNRELLPYTAKMEEKAAEINDTLPVVNMPPNP